jgi:AcrR family transcriptional regulator
MSEPDTKDVILDAAEVLFAEYGYEATSLRDLTQEAGVNLAAVNYHFGGKEQLAAAVLARRIGPINQERHRRLDALPPRPAVADVVRAFVEPAFPTATGCPTGHVAPGRDFCRLMGRMMIDQPAFLRTFLAGQFHELGSRFEATLRRALPRCDRATTWWRLHFMAGAMAHTLHSADAIAHLTGGLCDATDVDAVVEHLVAFTAAGLTAPAPRVRSNPRRCAASSAAASPAIRPAPAAAAGPARPPRRSRNTTNTRRRSRP